MQSFLHVLLLVAMVAVVLVLFTGLISFAAGGEFNRRYANKLMRLRVAAQALAVITIVLIVLLRNFAS